MASNVVPDRFDGGDFAHSLRHLERCSVANDWNDASRLAKLPAFLRGPGATFYDSLADGERDTYEHLMASLHRCFTPSVNREQYYNDFHAQELRPSESPTLFLWRLKDILRRAEPDLSADAFDALLRRQFMRGLPPPLRMKLLESDPTPDLDKMVQVAHRFHALDALPQPPATCLATAEEPLRATTPIGPDDARLTRLENLVYDLAANYPPVVATAGHCTAVAPSTRRPRCFYCGEIGHVVRSCALRRGEKRCTACGGWGHKPDVCANHLRSRHKDQEAAQVPSVDSNSSSKRKSFSLNFKGVPRY